MKKTIKDVDWAGKRAVVRCDFNVPLKDGVITDENRLVGALPTIKYLVENGAKVLLCSHLWKDASKTLAPVATRLSEMLGKEVVFARDEEVVGENARKVLDIIEQENTEDFQKMAAMEPSEEPYLKTSVLTLAKKRIVWLLVLMVSATVTFLY